MLLCGAGETLIDPARGLLTIRHAGGLLTRRQRPRHANHHAETRSHAPNLPRNPTLPASPWCRYALESVIGVTVTQQRAAPGAAHAHEHPWEREEHSRARVHGVHLYRDAGAKIHLDCCNCGARDAPR